MNQPETGMKRDPEHKRFRSTSQRLIVIGLAISGLYFLGFMVYYSLRPLPADGWLLQIISTHFAATIGVPLSALSAFCIVVLLDVFSKGDIELEIPGFKMKGASGPVILWVVCFIAFIFGLRLLWNI